MSYGPEEIREAWLDATCDPSRDVPSTAHIETERRRIAEHRMRPGYVSGDECPRVRLTVGLRVEAPPDRVGEIIALRQTVRGALPDVRCSRCRRVGATTASAEAWLLRHVCLSGGAPVADGDDRCQRVHVVYGRCLLRRDHEGQHRY